MFFSHLGILLFSAGFFEKSGLSFLIEKYAPFYPVSSVFFCRKREKDEKRRTSLSKKWKKPLFRVFARGYVHASGAHLPLEKCKKPRTGRGFLRIDKKQDKSFFTP
ncbi:hypothetical protein DW094_11645 [Ruminococcaceae bacterium AM07-15]|nr:hypothetical protein DW094_11645 [Ruminococcaceae bacterium AM07-15]